MKGFEQVEHGHGMETFVGTFDPDTSAVMGAKTSRAPDLQKRWEEIVEANDGSEDWDPHNPPEKVSKFLDQNLGSYGHSSVAEMANGCFVHGRGFGWPSAWMIEDFPLFKGQEISTRAVDPDKYPDSDQPCLYAPEGMEVLHQNWMGVFNEQKAEADKRGYKFDQVRWALPGTTRTGVTITTNARDALAHLRRVQSINPALAMGFVSGYERQAPRTVANYAREPRKPWQHWVPRLTSERAIHNLSLGLSLKMFRHGTAGAMFEGFPVPRRDGIRDHVDPLWAWDQRFEVWIYCSVAVARDWHRHRPVMPWVLEVPLAQSTRWLVPAPWYEGQRDFLLTDRGRDLWSATSDYFQRAYYRTQGSDEFPSAWEALHALPFGALVKLRCVATIPSLVYMLGLRALAKGGNFEYKAQALTGLRALWTFLGHKADALMLPEMISEAEKS